MIVNKTHPACRQSPTTILQADDWIYICEKGTETKLNWHLKKTATEFRSARCGVKINQKFT